MKRPTDQQFETAILWLQSNEGEERNDTMAVSLWLEAQMEERMLRQEARRAGVTYATLRRRMAERGMA